MIPANGELSLSEMSGTSIELLIEMDAAVSAQAGVKVCSSPDGQEQTLISYDRVAGQLKIDTTQASLGEGPRSVESGPLALEPDEPLRLRVFVDRSMIEVFANDRQAVTRCVYPTRGDSREVVLFSRSGNTLVNLVEAWDMAAANPW